MNQTPFELVVDLPHHSPGTLFPTLAFPGCSAYGIFLRWENGFIAGDFPQGRAKVPTSNSTRKRDIVKYSSGYTCVNFLSESCFKLENPRMCFIGKCSACADSCVLALVSTKGHPFSLLSSSWGLPKRTLNHPLGTLAKDYQLREWLTHMDPEKMTWIFTSKLNRQELLCYVYIGVRLQPTSKLPMPLGAQHWRSVCSHNKVGPMVIIKVGPCQCLLSLTFWTLPFLTPQVASEKKRAQGRKM